MRTVRVVAALIEQDGRYLITQRRDSAVLAGLWEFPGGRVEGEETDAQALKREIRERLDVEVSVREMVSFVSHPYERYTVDLYLYACTLDGGEPRTRAVRDFRWARSSEFDAYDFTPADEASMNILLGEAEV
ncbi:MAG: (deoxy)nucleoside triphosphate pyrophosphohydrolase [Myxococcales bacterium]|nr:(deoxy)nucleoside triphosphate pyrophosphohydrolase [Myxococcales bacterium]